MLLYVVGFGAVAYTAAYFHFYAKKPKVYVKPSSKLERLLSERVPDLQRPYYPICWCPEGRLQTIVRTFVQYNKQFSYKREVVPTADGGQFYIDWVENDKSAKFLDRDTRPTVFIVPGLTSTSKSNYVVSMVDLLSKNGYRVMVIVNRGLDGMEMLTPMAYCATHTMDMEVAIVRFKEKYPDAPLIAIGVSLGSLMLGRYLASKKDKCQLVAAMLHSCPFSPPHCSDSLERWENKILFNSFLTRGLKDIYGRFHHQFAHIVDHEEVLKSKTIRDYDTSFTAKVFGYSSVEDYYKDAILTEEKLRSFAVPTLCLCATDDPFSPYSALPIREVSRTENVALAITTGGGHVSHMEGFNPFAKTYFDKIMEQFVSGVFQDLT